MAGYRDTQAELRIDTLEARLAEANAALRAREVELVELRAEIGRLHGDLRRDEEVSVISDPKPGGLRVVTGALMLAMLASMVGFRVLGARTHCGSRAVESEVAHLRAALEMERHTNEALRAIPQPMVTPHVGEAGAVAGAEARPGHDFDRAAAARALAEKALAVKSCGTPNGTNRTVKVSVTFAPSGEVRSAVVHDPSLASTAVGACVAARFREARIPAFEGAPVIVSKSFSVEADIF